MELVFISGLPGVGKLTVAKELSAVTRFKLFHNHLTVDLLLAVFEFGSAPFVELRETIWLSVFERACRAKVTGLIFTFNAEITVRPSFITQTEETIANHDGKIHFVAFVCDDEELRRRMDTPARRLYRKHTSWPQCLEMKAAGVFSS